MCLKTGKHVLCEKPFTINAGEAEEVIATARAQNRFLMEAMWTRFLPAMKQVREWIDAGEIGEARMVQASFGYRNGVGTTYQAELGGGSLLDVGVYPITLADIAFNRLPERISSFAHIANGIDEQAALIFYYPGGELALLATAICTEMPGDAFIMGTKGMIKIAAPFWRTNSLNLLRPGQNDFVVQTSLVTEQRYNYQFRSVMECLRLGKVENEIMPWDKTLEIMRMLDEIRKQIGLRYPMEE
jgi:predicted dehydrogenase